MSRCFKLMALTLYIAGCAFRPDWHWEQKGTSDAEYQTDLRFCKSNTDQDLNGNVTYESVRRMHSCMEGRGWKKVAD